MREIAINHNEAGQRLDKFLGKYLKLAPKAFLYKMMRKKNNDIQNAQYLKNVISGVISMLGNENIILYDNIEQLDVQFRKQIKRVQ